MRCRFDASAGVNRLILMLGQEFVRVFFEIEKLRLANRSVHHIVLDQFPIALLYRPHARLGSAVVHTVEHVAYLWLTSQQDRLEACAFVRGGGVDTSQVAERCQDVHQVDVTFRTRMGLDAWPFDDKGNSPSVLIQVLFPLQAMSARWPFHGPRYR